MIGWLANRGRRSGRVVGAGVLVLGLAACAAPQTSTFERSVQNLRIGDDGVTVLADGVGNSCETPKLLVVRETSAEVIVTARIEKEGDVCRDIGIVTPLTAVIGEPLGGRALVSRCPDGIDCR